MVKKYEFYEFNENQALACVGTGMRTLILALSLVLVAAIPAHKEKDWWELVEAHLKKRAQALFPRVEVTLKTADALLILEAGRML